MPVLITTVPSDSPDGPIANVVSGVVEETALTSPPDSVRHRQWRRAPRRSAAISSQLVAFGADGPDFDLVNHVYDGFQLVAQADATTWVTGLGLTSHGQTVDFVAISGDTLTAWTGGGPSDPTAHDVFTLTVGGDGTYTFTLESPLDHPDAGHATPGPEVADSITLDLSGLVQAIDFDGDAITLSADFAVTVIDDIPVQHTVVPESEGEGGPKGLFFTVDEGGLTAGDPGDLFGSGNDPARRRARRARSRGS